jgi:short subunit dehydrogenase-like uncharacterized protein
MPEGLTCREHAADLARRHQRRLVGAMVESFRHGRRGGKVRRNGVIEEVPLAHSRRRVPLNWARPVLASAPVQKVLRRLADRSTGPSEEELRAGRSRFWGEVSNAAGKHRTARLETANGYRLTADGTIMAVKFLLDHAPAGGYPPSMLIGARFVEELPGSTPIRVD